jgi:hypothetical protein
MEINAFGSTVGAAVGTGAGGDFAQATVYVGVALTSVHASVIKGLEYNVVVVA